MIKNTALVKSAASAIYMSAEFNKLNRLFSINQISDNLRNIQVPDFMPYSV